MADYSAYGPWVGGDDWRAWVGVYVTSNTDTAITFRVESWVWSEYGTTSGYSNIRGAVAYGSNAWDRGSATSINTNSWKKLHEKSYTVNKTHAAQSIKCWALAEGISGTYSGSSSTATVYMTVPAKKSYTVSFNANSGSGAPAAQTKWHGENLTLSTVKPTRSNYSFLGWSTSSSATTATYAAGGTYSANAAATLYAVWKLNYASPKITNAKVRRCDSSGTLDDEGTYAKLELSWAVDSANGAALDSTHTLTVKWRQRGGSWGSATTLASSGTSGTVASTLGGGNLDVEKSYDFQISITDTHSLTTTQTITLSPAFFTMDVLSGGKGVAFGMPCTTEGFHLGMRLHEHTDLPVLWTGSYYMTDTQSITLGEKVSDQQHGIILVWSYYSSGQAQDYNFNYTTIPKWHVKLHPGGGVDCDMLTGTIRAHKYVYVSDQSITGHADNASTKTYASVTHTNGSFVLRAVLGF